MAECLQELMELEEITGGDTLASDRLVNCSSVWAREDVEGVDRGFLYYI